MKKVIFSFLLILSSQTIYPAITDMPYWPRSTFRSSGRVADWKHPFAGGRRTIKSSRKSLFERLAPSRHQEKVVLSEEEIKSKVLSEIKELIDQIKMIVDEKLNDDAKRHIAEQTNSFIENFGNSLEAAYKDGKNIEICHQSKKSFLTDLQEFINKQNQ